MDWNKAKSMVAGVDGLDVTFEDDNGQLGATRVPAGQQTAQRQPTAWGTTTYALVSTPLGGKKLTKPGHPFPPGMLLFAATEVEALNWAQSMSTPDYCWTLHKLVQVRQTNADFIREVNDVMMGKTSTFLQKVIVWSNCKLTGYYTADGSLVKAG